MSVAAVQLPFGGSLSAGNLEPVLVRLARDEATGILTVQGEEDIIAISFEDGRIVGADALNEPLEAGLGRALVSEGLLNRQQLAQVLERIGDEPGRIGEILISETGLSEADYLRSLRSYTRELVRRGSSWATGEYKFFGGDEVSSEEGFEPILVQEICSSAADAVAELADESRSEAADVVAEPPAPAFSSEASDDTWVEISGPLPSRPETDQKIDHRPPPSAQPAAQPTAQPAEQAVTERTAETGAPGAIERIPRWIWWVVPAAAAGVLLAVALWGRNLVFYPGFWLEPDRLAFEQQTRITAYEKIDRAAKTFFLLEGRFPENLHVLVASELLSPGDVVGPSGKVLTYVPGDRGYMILPAVNDGTDPGINQPEAIAGDFFLDPEYVVSAPDASAAPLVLLD